MAVVELNRVPSRSELRWFGVLVAAVFGIIGSVAYWQFGSLAAARILWGTGLALAAFYYLVPPARRPLHFLWMRAIAPIAFVVSHVVLGFVYYGLVTPIGLVHRVLAGDSLTRRFEREAPSYWVAREPTPEARRYFRQS